MPDVVRVTHLTVIQLCQYVRKCLISQKLLHHIALSSSERNKPSTELTTTSLLL